MKKLMVFVVGITLLFSSCNSGSGHLLGVQGRKVFFPEIPLGMVYIPSGSYTMGSSDEDVPFLHQSRSHVVSIHAMYMDQTEITNNEYREFVYWVRDSIFLEKVYENTDPTGSNGIDEEVIGDMLNHPDIYYDEVNLEWKEFDPSEPYINRELFSLSWRVKGIDDEQIIPLISDMYLRPNERFYKRREIDTRKLKFRYYWIDLQEAARKGRPNIVRNGYTPAGNLTNPSLDPQHRALKNPEHPFTGEPVGQDLDLGYFNKKGQNNALRSHEDRSRFIIDEVINVYPDTLCWVRDFTYSFNDPMTNMYFWHPAYDNYPVVGVTWVQAKAFAIWRTQKLNSWLHNVGSLWVQDFRLPNEGEWEYAARGNLKHSPYPWGGPYIRNSGGCMLGNFKPMRGRYFDDGGFYTVKAYSYNPNGYGLYCMAGNVAEWTETAFDESVYEFTHDLSPEYRYHAMDWDPPSMKRKVIRGGSWKDIGYYLQTGTRTYEYQDTAKSYVGFRCVQTHIGRGGDPFENEGGEELRSDIELQ
ncbi:T9SS ring complex lipoprotein PorK/GldK [Crocinitomix algicola]|uniref:type IX secretion system lipoprotein PorK/GldK n=1 Tax=Crocinitomix algicola TaxID=1740263 RepID=UPI0008732425|nr:SUMF1/EgtB/PvdO family nonheme iron enzyme [Crocinitomix algicola]